MDERERGEQAVAVMTDLLGKSGTLPVWLNPDKFLATAYDDEACVADLRRYVSKEGIQIFLGVCNGHF